MLGTFYNKLQSAFSNETGSKTYKYSYHGV